MRDRIRRAICWLLGHKDQCWCGRLTSHCARCGERIEVRESNGHGWIKPVSPPRDEDRPKGLPKLEPRERG